MIGEYWNELYVLELMRIVLPNRTFEITTAPVMLNGNSVRGICTLDIYALLHATPEQQSMASQLVNEIKDRHLQAIYHNRRREEEQ